MTACLLHNDPTSCFSLARLSLNIGGAAAKASSKKAIESVETDAKLCDLSMSRMKVG